MNPIPSKPPVTATTSVREGMRKEPEDGLRPEVVPDLHSQYEEILEAVWRAEANWRLDDRIDLLLKHRRPQADA